jgi:hypothetical protein
MTKFVHGGLALAVFLSAALVACGGHPGGTVGDSCGDPGSSSECQNDEICDNTDDGGTYCLRICTDHIDCAENERCNGVTGSSRKACHPQADLEEEECNPDETDCG